LSGRGAIVVEVVVVEVVDVGVAVVVSIAVVAVVVVEVVVVAGAPPPPLQAARRTISPPTRIGRAAKRLQLVEFMRGTSGRSRCSLYPIAQAH
jgi:hypothetical protein